MASALAESTNLNAAAADAGQGKVAGPQATDYTVGQRVWYMSKTHNEEVKGRVTRVESGIVDLNVRDEADLCQVRPRDDADASDDDEYDYLEGTDEESQEEDEAGDDDTEDEEEEDVAEGDEELVTQEAMDEYFAAIEGGDQGA
jgi:hypothetical protein